MSVAPTSPSSRRRLWFRSVIYRLFTVDRASLFSANQLVPSYSERGHAPLSPRSAPGNASPAPDPKRTAKPTDGVGKGSEIMRLMIVAVTVNQDRI
jgi:hypothetical protein